MTEFESLSRKVIIEAEDLHLLLRYGVIDLEDAGIELVLRRTKDDEEIIQKRVVKPLGKKGSATGRIYLPADWVGEEVVVIRL